MSEERVEPVSYTHLMVLLGTFFIGILLTPLVRILAFKIDAVDYPNARRINKKPMPSAGGLAVVIAFSITSLIMMPTIVQVTFRGETYFDYIWPVVLGGGVVALTGLIDDVKELSPLPLSLIHICNRTLLDSIFETTQE